MCYPAQTGAIRLSINRPSNPILRPYFITILLLIILGYADW